MIRAATRLRVVGPLCATDGTLVQLDGFDGDAAGPVIHLAPDGRSLPNHHLTRLFDLEAPERP